MALKLPRLPSHVTELLLTVVVGFLINFDVTFAAWAADDQYAKLGRLNLNTDPRYSRWPVATHVPYQIADDYSSSELDLIHDAMHQIFLDSLGCVKFVEYDNITDAGQDYVYISPAIDGTCWSYPGLLPSGGTGQKLGISSGKYGCLDNKRLVMKTLFHVLGKRSEHNRPDRDDYLEMHLDNLDPVFAPFAPYQKYLDSTVYYQGFPYDYNSITHHLPTAYANPGKTVFTLRDETKSIGNKSRLSYWDCYAMAMQYQCQDIMKNDLCTNLDSYRQTVTVVAGVPKRQSGGSKVLGVNFSANSKNLSHRRPPRTTMSTTATTSTTTTATTTTQPPTTTLTEDTTEVFIPPYSEDDLVMVPDDPKANNIADYVTLVRKGSQGIRTICDPGFLVDAAVQGQDGGIIIFSEGDYYIITTSGHIKDGPLPISRDFPDVASLPITAAYSTYELNQKTTHIIAAQNDYSYVDLTFLDYLPIVEDDLLSLNLRTIFTLPDPRNSNNDFEFRIYSGNDPNMQYIQLNAGGKKIPLTKSRFFIGSSANTPSTIDAVVSFKLGSLGNTQDAALVFSRDLIYLMDVDYSCIQILRRPCLNATKRPRFPLPIRNVLNCNAYSLGRSYTSQIPVTSKI